MKLILASQSPRRQQLLAQTGFPFEIRPLPHIDESFPAHLRAEDIPRFLARKKAEACLADMAADNRFLADDEALITADTIVWCDNVAVGKPADRDDAFRMLRMLSGRTHQVITAVCLTSQHYAKVFAETSAVTFATLDPEDIRYYIDRFRPYDKAGAYGIQEWLGNVAVTRIEGSFTNIMGLPLQPLYSELKALFSTP